MEIVWDDFVEKHFQAWIDNGNLRTFDNPDEIEQAMRDLVADDPYLLNWSWHDILNTVVRNINMGIGRKT